FDYVMLALPGILLAIWAEVQIGRVLAAGRQAPAASGLTGAQVARMVLRAGGPELVEIEGATGELSSSYDTGGKVLRLARSVFEGRSLAALGVAAHEAGHAIQDASGYPGLVLRNVIAPLAGLGSEVVWILITAGVWLGMLRLIILGICLFWLNLVFQLLN